MKLVALLMSRNRCSLERLSKLFFGGGGAAAAAAAASYGLLPYLLLRYLLLLRMRRKSMVDVDFLLGWIYRTSSFRLAVDITSANRRLCAIMISPYLYLSPN